MMKPRHHRPIRRLATLSLAAFLLRLSSPAIADTAHKNSASFPISWGDPTWNLQLDSATGALIRIENRADPEKMNWLREPGHWEFRDWIADTSPNAVTLDGQWGLVETNYSGRMHVAEVRRLSERAWEAVYRNALLTVTIRRQLESHGDLVETYTFENTGVVDLELPVGSVAITTPFFDQYPDARESLTHRCHAHIWTGGSSAWVNAMRMGAQPPHLGLIMTEGRLEAYSQEGCAFNDRGVFLLHPGAMHLKHGESATLSWRIFWHTGWEDFFAKLSTVPGFVRITAEDYVVAVGETLAIAAESISGLKGASILANGNPVQASIEGETLSASIPATTPGDLIVTLDHDGRKSTLRAFVTPPIDALIDARVKFIIRKQQRHAPGDPLDGAYLIYDNETSEQIYNPSRSDHNAGRERIGMGVLGALYLPLCRDEDFRAELTESLQRYNAFIIRELEDEDGVVYERIGRKRHGRIYNFIWVAHFHLAMYLATGEEEQLDRFVRVMRAYYATEEGAQFYPIGIPASDGLRALKQAGRIGDHDELLTNLRSHADFYLDTGRDYPRSEVNYEQSIVAPAVQLLAEMYVITRDKRYLRGAQDQMPLLEAFAGKQPDGRLHEIAIRHWDGFWFGKLRTYGDTMPHYWSSINALAYAYYGLATEDRAWIDRADDVVRGNLPLFTPKGAGSAAYLNALSTNGHPGERNDPWANDQDWALVNLLMLREVSFESKPLKR
jgi:hypothetical protein